MPPTLPIVRAALPALVAVLLAAVGGNPASAATDTFDFGLLGASLTAPSSGTSCTADCVIAGKAEQYFTTGGVSIGAIGFNASGNVSYVTQKPGAFAANGDETGIGESDTYPISSDTDYEITKATWLLIDNTQALAAGYLSSTLSIESIQAGEGANIYSYSGSLMTLDPAKLTLLATMENPNTGTSATQTVSVPNNSKYLVVQAAGTSSGSDVVVGEVVLNTHPVPEPASLTLFGVGVAGLVALRRRRGRSWAANRPRRGPAAACDADGAPSSFG